MKEKRKYITIGKKTFVVVIAGGKDNDCWHVIPTFSIIYDRYCKTSRIVLGFLRLWCGVWVKCDKNHQKI